MKKSSHELLIALALATALTVLFGSQDEARAGSGATSAGSVNATGMYSGLTVTTGDPDAPDGLAPRPNNGSRRMQPGDPMAGEAGGTMGAVWRSWTRWIWAAWCGTTVR